MLNMKTWKQNKRYILTAITVLFVVGLVIFAISSALVPVQYLVVAAVLLFAICLLLVVLQRKWGRIRFAVSVVIEVFVIAVSCYGMSVFYHAAHMVHEITETVTETESVSAYVLSDCGYQSLKEAAQDNIGIVSGQSAEAVDKVLTDVFAEDKAVLRLIRYDDMFEAVDALRDSSITVLVLNDAYAGLISEIEGYEWFITETKVLEHFLQEVETEVKFEEMSEQQGQGDGLGISGEKNTGEEPAEIQTPETEAAGDREGADTKEVADVKEDADTKPGEPVKELMEAPEQVDWNALVNRELLEVPEGAFVLYVSGVDTWGSAGARSRSDVNILAVVNTNTKEVLLVSTPRDYYVPLSNSNGVKDKLTHAGIYGIDTSIGTLELLYGVDIQYYVRMNFTGFVNIVDAVGGVDVYSDTTFSVGDAFSYTEGINHMNGIEALAFARERHSFAGGDRARGTHQMEVIKAVLNKCTSSAILYNYADVMNSISGCFTTNMPQDKIASLVRMQLGDMAQWTITSMSVDGTGASKTTYTVPGKKAYVMIPDDTTVQRAKESIATVLGGQ